MTSSAYHTLIGEDVGYPEDTAHAYLKLFSHAWNFGRVDLGVLAIEWILYLIFTAFIAVKSAQLVKWDFAYISIPLYIAVILGCMRTAFCGKRSRCGMISRAYFASAIILSYIFLILKIESFVHWSWQIIFVPVYVTMGILLVGVGAYWIWIMRSINDDRLFKFFLFVMWTFFPLAVVFISFLASKLDGTLKWSWWVIFSPIFAFQAFLLATSPFFFIFFPDRSFLADRVGTSFGKSIKPRYRVNIIYLTAAVLNLPIALFNLFLCLHLQHGRFPWPAVFSPLFVAEIVALGLLFALINARKKRGTYCVRVDAGPGVPIREIW